MQKGLCVAMVARADDMIKQTCGVGVTLPVVCRGGVGPTGGLRKEDVIAQIIGDALYTTWVSSWTNIPASSVMRRR